MMFYLKNKISGNIISFIFITIVIVSCNNKPEGIIKQGKMARFLADLHKLDGGLSMKGFSATQDRENVYYYNSLLKKYDISKAEFDSSLVWYTKNPKQFDKVYNEVIEYLNVEDSIQKQKMIAFEDSLLNAPKEIEIWNKPKRFALTKDSARNKIEFLIDSIELFSHDIYELKFLHRVAPSDSGLNQHAVFRIHYENGITDSIFTKTINDSILRRYNLHLVARHKHKIERLTGSILESSSYKGVQNAIIDSISLSRKYSPIIQKEIQKEIEKNNSGNLNNDSTRIRLPHMPRSASSFKTDKNLKIK